MGLLPPWYPVFDENVTIGVTINKNVQAYPHRDAKNAGSSIIMFLGNFEGGALCLEDGRAFTEKLVWHEYDGAKLTHWNTEFIGTRYSVIVHRKVGSYQMYKNAPQPGGAPKDEFPQDPTDG